MAFNSSITWALITENHNFSGDRTLSRTTYLNESFVLKCDSCEPQLSSIFYIQNSVFFNIIFHPLH